MRKVDADDPVSVHHVGKNLLHQRSPAPALIRRAVAKLGDLLDAALRDLGADQASMIDKLRRKRLLRRPTTARAVDAIKIGRIDGKRLEGHLAATLCFQIWHKRGNCGW